MAVTSIQKWIAASLIAAFLLGSWLTDYITASGLAAMLATYGLGRLMSDALYGLAALMPSDGGAAAGIGNEPYAWLNGLTAGSSVVGLLVGMKARMFLEAQIATYTLWHSPANYSLMAFIIVVAVLRNRSSMSDIVDRLGAGGGGGAPHDGRGALHRPHG